jgi:hypothetical protein
MKGFLILTGDNNAKNILQEKLKEEYWIWNVSTLNHLRHNAVALGWEFTDNSISDEFIQKLLDISNEYLDYEYRYVVKFVDKIMESKKAQENNKKGDLLIAHVNKDLSERLQDEFNFFVLNVTMDKLVENNFQNGKFILGLGDEKEKVNQAINNILEIISVNKENI